MKTLHLTLKKKWFDMILSGKKKDEYREIKPYWINRLCHKGYLKYSKPTQEDLVIPYYEGMNLFDAIKLDFGTVTFKNGYVADAPEIVVELKAIEIKEGNPDWGAVQGVKYFVLSLGKILSTKNIKQ